MVMHYDDFCESNQNDPLGHVRMMIGLFFFPWKWSTTIQVFELEVRHSSSGIGWSGLRAGAVGRLSARWAFRLPDAAIGFFVSGRCSVGPWGLVQPHLPMPVAHALHWFLLASTIDSTGKGQSRSKWWDIGRRSYTVSQRCFFSLSEQVISHGDECNFNPYPSILQYFNPRNPIRWTHNLQDIPKIYLYRWAGERVKKTMGLLQISLPPSQASLSASNSHAWPKHQLLWLQLPDSADAVMRRSDRSTERIPSGDFGMDDPRSESAHTHTFVCIYIYDMCISIKLSGIYFPYWMGKHFQQVGDTLAMLAPYMEGQVEKALVICFRAPRPSQYHVMIHISLSIYIHIHISIIQYTERSFASSWVGCYFCILVGDCYPWEKLSS